MTVVVVAATGVAGVVVYCCYRCSTKCRSSVVVWCDGTSVVSCVVICCSVVWLVMKVFQN